MRGGAAALAGDESTGFFAAIGWLKGSDIIGKLRPGGLLVKISQQPRGGTDIFPAYFRQKNGFLKLKFTGHVPVLLLFHCLQICGRVDFFQFADAAGLGFAVDDFPARAE